MGFEGLNIIRQLAELRYLGINLNQSLIRLGDPYVGHRRSSLRSGNANTRIIKSFIYSPYRHAKTHFPSRWCSFGDAHVRGLEKDL